jgi:nucleoid-associated protein YgaU
MYKSLLIAATLLVLTACAGTYKDDDLQITAEDKYKDATTLVDKAKSYNLNVGEAENQLAQAGTQIEEEQYKESIVSSEEARRLASNAIEVYEYAEAKTAEDIKAAKEEQSRIAAAEQKRLSESSTEYPVRKGDTLWSIAATQKKLNYDALSWPLIYKENQSIIDDPDLIYVNMVLRITAPTQPEQVAKARRHAQTRGDWSVGTREDKDQKYLQQ